ncbi:Cell division protease ftsH [Phytophthora nicotianae]|uniref:Cell division protease ftsH n=1 Tax=Phytophthora nicotianae TaxID=4792 RepID=A0A0W8CV21_PHYNI|nr:Cell division protease ftsH [Phytophthora nicotianae]
MVFSDILKFKFGPFWFKTSILLVNVMPFGTRNATYVLRVERPSFCGGRIELPIGHHGFPIDLLTLSAKDRRKLQFTIRYGAKGKKLRFLAPTAEVYGHWISVLHQAFEANIKVAKRTCSQIVSSTSNTSVGVSPSCYCSNSDLQKTTVLIDIDSTSEQQGSEMDMSVTTSESCYQYGSIVADINSSSNHDNFDDFDESPAPRAATHIATIDNPFAPSVMDVVYDDDSNDFDSPESSGELESPLTSSVNAPPTDENANTGQQKVFCMTIDHDSTTAFSVYVPPQKARDSQTVRRAEVFDLSFAKWAGWMARDIRDGNLPEAFCVARDTCKRLELNDILNIVQPYFA